MPPSMTFSNCKQAAPDLGRSIGGGGEHCVEIFGNFLDARVFSRWNVENGFGARLRPFPRLLRSAFVRRRRAGSEKATFVDSVIL